MANIKQKVSEIFLYFTLVYLYYMMIYCYTMIYPESTVLVYWSIQCYWKEGLVRVLQLL